MDAIQGLQPVSLWEQFAKISEIPRPSKKEERVAAYIVGLARAHDLDVQRDPTGNIVVRKPASSGKSSSPVVCLQSHIDMVCEKNKDVDHDFDKDGIQLMRANGSIKAKGTTLGSDNGIGVAAALSVLLDKSLIHGPIECLFTVDEETGLTGAAGLKPGFLKSRVLLNLDSEEEGALYVGCAGGRDTILRLSVEREGVPEGFVPVGLNVSGLRGGHSGLDINTGRGNAIKLLARALWFLSRVNDIRLESIEGGSKRNAIPREAEAVIYIRGERLKSLRTRLDELKNPLSLELAATDPNVMVEISPGRPTGTGQVLRPEDSERLMSLLYAIPHGVTGMSADIPGLVETSTNLATIQMEPGKVVIGTSQRSSVHSSLDDLLTRVGLIGSLAGAAAEHTDGYPGWKPDMQSRSLRIASETYRELFGTDPQIKAIHAGLECGIIGERYPGMDMVSFGPTILGAHSPDEQVEIASVQKFWDLLVKMLQNLS